MKIEWVKNPDFIQGKSCITCSRCDLCPLIKLWVELTEAPIEICNFYCSEYLKEELPV